VAGRPGSPARSETLDSRRTVVLRSALGGKIKCLVYSLEPSAVLHGSPNAIGIARRHQSWRMVLRLKHGTLFLLAGTGRAPNMLPARYRIQNRVGMGTSLRASLPYPGWLVNHTVSFCAQNATPQQAAPRPPYLPLAPVLAPVPDISHISQQPRPTPHSACFAFFTIPLVLQLAAFIFLAQQRRAHSTSPPRYPGQEIIERLLSPSLHEYCMQSVAETWRWSVHTSAPCLPRSSQSRRELVQCIVPVSTSRAAILIPWVPESFQFGNNIK
jgi:hypothetical protein